MDIHDFVVLFLVRFKSNKRRRWLWLLFLKSPRFKHFVMDWYSFNYFHIGRFLIPFFKSEDQGNPLNIPSLYSGALLDASTKTQPVEPVIYRPELKRSDKSFPYLRTPKFDSDWLYRMFRPIILQPLPTFIISFLTNRTNIYCII